ncbi:MAG TPA: amidohydrolase family protein [Paracoccus sp. (in: a-proteobacteria)]|uniref:amidohydrolase family protein n=1 Tax=uncultured Paracoccus sp. TaxID=189685 RepID=UPI00262EE6CD|nr:amidohydrolase family protein [uncultured Paracoccus sp.]HMQ40073.1 amidohydrolase family protein [Paracoccus sp. (in: a-proteobacteria)]HMR35321.1 amidohydrolase family protein [Paracoccus sp. (in: a-proteobacteria)]
MTPKIALEEHFMAPGFEDYWALTAPNISPELFGKANDALMDFGERRLAGMDEIGVDKAILSLSGPGVQAEPDTRTAIRKAQEVNDFLAREIQARPDRYGGFAHLAVQDPAAAADELERCVRDLGMQGAMINGQTNGTYLDDDRISPLWERAEALGAPIYIHPNNPPDVPYMYQAHSELWGPVWSWTVETGNHALRLIFGGVFDRFPKAKLMLGHMGETLPYQLWRFDSRWEISNRKEKRLAMKPSEYFRRNFWCTTAGVCSDEPLRCALDALGDDRVLFAVDYPYERPAEAGEWIEAAAITDAQRRAVCRDNAVQLLGL